ncbi:MAG: ABC transporter permease, partial [Dehalococcoidia bacterium]|nr:ABC transporter permease [Dehalococcoidia bacterium]
YALIIAWGIVTITFILLRVAPGSPADRYLLNMSAKGQDVTQAIASIEARYGVDQPVWEQYRDYVVNLVRGDWGWSISTSMPVMTLLRRHWIYSFQLILLSSLFASLLGMAAGVYSAVKQRTRADYITTF